MEVSAVVFTDGRGATSLAARRYTNDIVGADAVALREHLLNRFGYGGSPQSRELYAQLGPGGWMQAQIDLCSVGERGGLDPWEQPPAWHQDDGDGSLQDGRAGTLRTLILRSIADEPSLASVLRDHWFNHFNIFAYMGVSKHQLHNYLNDAIMPSIVGRFGDMLIATMKHPTMLQYLNNRKNHKEIASPIVNGKVRPVGPNQNYAREVLELHTVGATNHTQGDVVEATKVLSGVSVNFKGKDLSRYLWQPDWHDTTAKRVLGHDFPAGGDEGEIQDFVDMLAANIHTAGTVAAKLTQRFVGPTAGSSAIDRLTQAFHGAVNQSHPADLRQVMLHLTEMPEMVDPANFRSKFKPPHRFIVSAYRALGATPSPDVLDDLVEELVLMGDMPFFFGPPTGYPDFDPFWLTGDGLTGRAQVARKIAQDPAVEAALLGSSVAQENDPRHIAIRALVPAGLSRQSAQAVEAAQSLAPSNQLSAVIETVLSSPEFLEY